MTTPAVPPVADELPPHGYSQTLPVLGSEFALELAFVLTRDEIYVPVGIRKPHGAGPFPVITMGRGNGRGGMRLIEQQVVRYAPQLDEILRRGYAIAYVNYRNEIPYLYGEVDAASNVGDNISGGTRTLKSAPTLDSHDLIAIWRYLAAQAWVDRTAIGAIGISHGGEMILKACAESTLCAAGVAVEGASHEFLSVETGPAAPRAGTELQYHDIEVVRRNADKATAMARIRNIATPILHMGRDPDHLQGIFKLAHEWMREAGKDSTWVSFDHPDHGYPFVDRSYDGRYTPDPVQRQAFDTFMDWFDQRLKRRKG